MKAWYLRQIQRLRKPPAAFRTPSGLLDLEPSLDFDSSTSGLSDSDFARLKKAREQLRNLVEAGEIDFETLNPRMVWDWAFGDDDDEAEENKQKKSEAELIAV